MINQDLTVGPGETVTTWSGTQQRPNSVKYNGIILINSGGIWRPMDAKAINVYGTFELKSGALLDLSYKYGENYPNNPWGTYDNINLASSRNFLTYGKTVLHDGSIIRLNVGGGNDTINLSDKLVFNNLQLAAAEAAATVRLQIRYNKNTGGLGGKNSAANFWDSATANVYSGRIYTLITINNLTKTVGDNLNFSAETYYMDSSLKKYLFVPTLTSAESTSNGVTTKYYNLDWTATRTDFISQGVFSAANAQLAMRNLWRMEDGLFWKRGEELRSVGRLGPGEGSDGAWAQVWRGKYDFGGAIGSSFGQTYNGIQVGYDKEREGKLFGGKLYTGLFLSNLTSKADFHQYNIQNDSDTIAYNHGSGDLKSGGLGLYTTWIGDKGHYLDFTVRGSKLSNEYNYFDSNDILHANDYGTWAYGAGLRYGYQKELPGGWYLEPQAGLSYGRMKGYSYLQDTNMRYNQDEMDMLIGRLGVTAGRKFGSDGKRGLVYAKAAVNHDFKDGGKANAEALTWNKNLNGGGPGGWEVGATLPMDTLAGKDTWYEFALGTTVQTGRDKNAFVELTKTTGGKVNTDWQVNAGLSWRFNGPSAADRDQARGASLNRSLNSLTRPAGRQPDAGKFGPLQANTGQVPEPTAVPAGAVEQVEKALPNEQANQGDLTGSVKTDGNNSLPSDNQSTQAQDAPPAAQTGQAGYTEPVNNAGRNPQSDRLALGPIVIGTEPGVYTLAPLVVEAARPDWEKKLSPGTVSVIPVPKYKGEMKNLPDLLQTVPGVYVQRLQGTGHYSVARVRGATGGQVNIYVDGVLFNSASEAAVDLSTIPIENVERIEVYRGYVPARFAGSPLGGAINIVTKKPQDTKGSISAGMRSLGGYTGNLELTAPAGGGSLLFALNRDQSISDFSYNHYMYNYNGVVGKATDTSEGKRWRTNNQYHNTDALLKWQDDNWFAKLTWQENKTAFPQNALLTWEEQKERHDRYQETEKTALSLGRRQTAGNLEWGWRLDGSYQYKQATEQEVKSMASGNNKMTADNEFRSRRFGGAVDGSWKLGRGHLVEFLFDASRETMNVDNNNFEKWPSWLNNVSSGYKEQYKKFFKNDYRISNYYFQVQDTMTLNRSGNLFFTPLLRAQKMNMNIGTTGDFSLDPDFDRWKYSYGLGLKKVQNEHWTFRGTYGTYYKFPNFYELFGDGVNVLSRWDMFTTTSNQGFLLNSFVERGTSWDLSANWQGKALNADADVTLTYFNRHSKNLLSYAIEPHGYGYYTNIGAGNIQGLELESKLNWKRWDLLLAGTWNDSLITTGGTKPLVGASEMNVGNPFPWIPEWEANARLGYRFPGDKLSAFAEYHYLGKVGTAITSASTGNDPYHAEKKNESLGLTNIGLKYAFNKQLKLTAGVNDLFNKGPDQRWNYIEQRFTDGVVWTGSGNVQHPQQGRTYYMTMQYFF